MEFDMRGAHENFLNDPTILAPNLAGSITQGFPWKQD